jgi:pyruvate kinase
MSRTKIVATLGPASQDPHVIESLIAAGVDVFRLNFSHGTHQSHAETYRRVRDAAKQSSRIVSVMQDLSGPKIRTGTLEGDGQLMLEDGSELRIRAGDGPGRAGLIFTPYAELLRAAAPGDRLLLDDGRIELRVTAASGDELKTQVINGGLLGAHKGISAPGVALPSSAVTEKDADDLRFGLSLGVDFVALSFVQTADDLRRARSIMDESGRVAPLIAKIERPTAVTNLDAILGFAQGVMVARGDLGLEMPLEQVPRVQKEIIRRSRAAGRPVIVATQVLESMRTEPRPTRAEVSDAANAVVEGADAIMLAGETAIGAWPARTVQTLSTIIVEAERMPSERVALADDPLTSSHSRALCEAAVTLATTGQADAIVAVTRGGKTARLLSALRPGIRIIAATEDESIARMLSLYRCVTPVIAPLQDLNALERLLIDRQLVAAGSVIVFISVNPDMTRLDTNYVNVQKAG